MKHVSVSRRHVEFRTKPAKWIVDAKRHKPLDTCAVLIRVLFFWHATLLVLVGGHVTAGCAGAGSWSCDRAPIPFSHQPSDYYGSGEYTTVCPITKTPIRCYHYHRHWICEKQDMLYWDRNLESAARLACQCPLPSGMAPSSPAIVRKPENRFHSVPAPKRLPSAPNPPHDPTP